MGVGEEQEGGGSTVMNIDNMKLHLLDFESARTRRLRTLQGLSRLSLGVGHLDSEVLAG
jgi:hypothetical protein